MRHLVLKGTARERGLAHGAAWPQEIKDFAALRKGLLKAALSSWSEEKLNALLDAHLDVLKRDNDTWEEFCGIAEAANVSHRDLMILNNHTDLRDFGDSDFDESLLECSCFAFKQGSKIVAGQSWDMHGSAKPYVAHLSIQKDQQRQEVFTLTGCLGLAGVTSDKFGVFINNLRSREVAFGYAWPVVVRKALDCKSINEAEKTIQKFMPSGGRNFLLVDQSQATNLEVTSKQLQRQGDLNSGYLFHTNHYLSELKRYEESSTRSHTTLNRYACLEKLAPEVVQSPLSLGSVCDKILSPKDSPLSIAPSNSDPHASATCGGLIYDFETESGLSFEGLFSEKNHLSISKSHNKNS